MLCPDCAGEMLAAKVVLPSGKYDVALCPDSECGSVVSDRAVLEEMCETEIRDATGRAGHYFEVDKDAPIESQFVPVLH